VTRLAALVARSVDLEAVIALARSAPPLAAVPWDPRNALHDPEGFSADPTEKSSGSWNGGGRRPVVAVAGGAAFTFCYTETVELLRAAGADVVTVDPLRDEALPPGTGALILGGGFPEVHARDLSANARLRADVARLARSGAPVVAECAGLLYLAGQLDGQPMCGVLDATARMTGRLTLGYRDAVAASPSVLGPAGTAVRGHEFHRTTVDAGAPVAPAWSYGMTKEGFVRGGVHASYLHLHWAGQPGLAGRVVAAAAGAGA
jgi:cobyrinic acid a,c-diamide synthase